MMCQKSFFDVLDRTAFTAGQSQMAIKIQAIV